MTDLIILIRKLMINIVYIFIIIFILFSCNSNEKSRIIEYYESGNIKMIAEINKDGDFHGEMKYYFDNGNLKLESISRWRNGVQHGKAVRYHKNNNINVLVNWNDGIRDGKYFKQDSLNLPLKDGKYVNGKFYGSIFEYDEKNQIIMKHIVKNDTINSYVKYLEDGKTENWQTAYTSEFFFIDINSDTLSRNDNLKIKFTANHKIADSIVFFNSSGSTLFNYPKEKIVSKVHMIDNSNLGNNSLSGYAKLYYKDSFIRSNTELPDSLQFVINYFIGGSN